MSARIVTIHASSRPLDFEIASSTAASSLSTAPRDSPPTPRDSPPTSVSTIRYGVVAVGRHAVSTVHDRFLGLFRLETVAAHDRHHHTHDVCQPTRGHHTSTVRARRLRQHSSRNSCSKRKRPPHRDRANNVPVEARVHPSVQIDPPRREKMSLRAPKVTPASCDIPTCTDGHGRARTGTDRCAEWRLKTLCPRFPSFTHSTSLALRSVCSFALYGRRGRHTRHQGGHLFSQGMRVLQRGRNATLQSGVLLLHFRQASRHVVVGRGHAAQLVPCPSCPSYRAWPHVFSPVS